MVFVLLKSYTIFKGVVGDVPISISGNTTAIHIVCSVNTCVNLTTVYSSNDGIAFGLTMRDTCYTANIFLAFIFNTIAINMKI